MAVSYAFANASVSIPLFELDSNFNTPIIIGNTAVQLGDTITTLNNMTLANVTISSTYTPITASQGGTGLTAPGTAGNVLTSTGTGWVSSAGGSSNAAPNTASYVLVSSNGNLSSGRVLTAGTNVTITDNGPGNTVVIAASGGGGGSGTVTSVSVVSANGFAGTVANATTTPAITLKTSVTGLLKGNGTAISAATANTDYQSPITLTTTGTSGAATLISNTLNIPQYSGGGGGSSVNGQAFTAGGTFTIPTGITSLKVTVVGGGGGSGGSYSGMNSNGGVTGGGGGGGTAISYLTGLTPGNTLIVTIGSGGTAGTTAPTSGGAGGSSTVASGTQTITTITGAGGSGSPGSNGQPLSYGAAGGSGSGGTINLAGSGGSFAFNYPGNGGSSSIGGGSTNSGSGSGGLSPGVVGGNYGGGAAGSYAGAEAGGAVGGAGAGGAVIFEW